jgi:putative tricarboxylic transport membrane protein
MESRINIPDLAFGGFLIALGALAFVLAGELTVGSAASMGPGYVPRGLAILIIVYGAALGAHAAFAQRLAFPAIELRPWLLISGSVALFALLLPLAGLALTGVAVVFCAGFAAHDVRMRENALFAVALAAFAVVLFVTALGLPIRMWPW